MKSAAEASGESNFDFFFFSPRVLNSCKPDLKTDQANNENTYEKTQLWTSVLEGQQSVKIFKYLSL